MRLATTTLLALTLAFAAQADGPAQSQPSTDEDRVVLAAALEDFAKWKKATFGKFNGVLAVEPQSRRLPDATVESVMSLASNIRSKIEPALALSFVDRNRIGTDVASLIAGSRWAQPYVRPEGDPPRWQEPPAGAKAFGQLTLPGYSTNGSEAIVQLHHSWSVHSAVVTYLLVRKGAGWRVVARDQAVYW